MLRALELGLYDQLLGDTVSTVIYVAIPGHIQRAAGEVPWDPFGPKYIIDPSDSLRYVGPFTVIPNGLSAPYYFFKRVMQVARRSAVINIGVEAFSSTSNSQENITRKVRLFGRILEKSSQIVSQKFNAELLVLFWDNEHSVSTLLKEQLELSNIHTVLVSDYITLQDRSSFEIPDDGHPNARANQLLGRVLSDVISP